MRRRRHPARRARVVVAVGGTTAFGALIVPIRHATLEAQAARAAAPPAAAPGIGTAGAVPDDASPASPSPSPLDTLPGAAVVPDLSPALPVSAPLEDTAPPPDTTPTTTATTASTSAPVTTVPAAVAASGAVPTTAPPASASRSAVSRTGAPPTTAAAAPAEPAAAPAPDPTAPPMTEPPATAPPTAAPATAPPATPPPTTTPPATTPSATTPGDRTARHHAAHERADDRLVRATHPVDHDLPRELTLPGRPGENLSPMSAHRVDPLKSPVPACRCNVHANRGVRVTPTSIAVRPDAELAAIHRALSTPEDHPAAMSRRRFLQLAAIGGAMAATPEFLHRAEAWAAPLRPGEQVLVSIFLAGGNDGLNTVVPYTDGNYAAHRPTVRLDPATLLAIDGRIGLHPSLVRLKARYDAGRVAIVQNVGFAGLSQSHFVATAQWMAGHRSGGNPGSGWLGRFLDGVPDAGDVFRAVTLGSSVPLLMRGNVHRATALPPSGSGSLFGSNRSSATNRRMFDCLSASAADDTGLGSLAALIGDTNAATMEAAVTASPRYQPTLPSGFPGTLTLVARLVNADLGTRVFHTTLGGFDTHDSQLGTHATLLTQLDTAIEAFYATLDPAFASRVALVVWSEFGRPVFQNGSNGTDHGAAGPVLVIGDGVRGGLLGNPPALGATTRNVPAEIDMRSVFGTVLDRWLGADSNAVIGASYESLPLFAAAGSAAPGSAAPGGAAAPATIRSGAGYWVVATDGTVGAYGGATAVPALPTSSSPVVGAAATPARDGFWAVRADGSVVARGAAPTYGDMSAARLNAPVVGMAATPTGRGYWLLGRDGGVFAFGDAAFFGSTGSMRLNQPVVGMAPTPSGRGYWFVASDGGIFAYGPDAGFHGSMGGRPLNRPIVGMAPTPSGRGYWLVASDGGIFAFGDAGFFGSTGAIKLNRPIVSMQATPTGRGYWFVASDGGIFAYGDATFHGAMTDSGKTIAGMV